MANRPGVIAVAAVLLAAGCSAPAAPRPDTTSGGGATSGAVPGGGPTSTAPGGGPTTGEPGRTAQGVLRITTQLGEQCGHIVVTPDPRCDPKPRPGTGFEIRATTRDFVARGHSGPDGQVTVPVDPGTYLVSGQPVPGYQLTPELRVTVGADATVAVPLTYAHGSR
ncbi:hypothetical protein AB0C04_17200 [Micromonospora sp. NPDC048909]|uniref:hypothetical protein n=1 Tax=Micromonospora sp. NPDC048909 TaxID=3155643 RepID=UPI0033D7B1E6